MRIIYGGLACALCLWLQPPLLQLHKNFTVVVSLQHAAAAASIDLTKTDYTVYQEQNYNV